MSKLTFTTLKNLVNQMKENNVDKDKFSFVYKVKFDVIVAIVHEGYELLVGLHTVNYGFVVKVNQNFVAELKEDDYYNLCKYLNLSFRNDGFTSNVFLKGVNLFLLVLENIITLNPMSFNLSIKSFTFLDGFFILLGTKVLSKSNNKHLMPYDFNFL